jgi:hypothetical protein
MRAAALLIAPGACCLVVGLFGLCISGLLLASPRGFFDAGDAGLFAGTVLTIAGILLSAAAFVIADRRQRRRLRAVFTGWAFVAAIMAIPTAVMFGPTGAFHHHVGFGFPFFYMVWNGEDPDPGGFLIGGYEVWFDPLRCGILLLIWLMMCAALIAGIVRPMWNVEVPASGGGRPAADH